MLVLESDRVDQGLYEALGYLTREGSRQTSRAGTVYSFDTPVTIIHRNPLNMVSTCDVRDANPFFHYFEAMWMLAGKKDARWLDKFVSNFSERFAEKDGAQHGAYGWRWRQHFGMDQLNKVVELLKKNPQNRRAVIQMWDADVDLGFNVKDVPCNLVVVPRIRNKELDITVYNRSNDIIWGACGSNAVHFAYLQYWMAAQLGLDVGTYYQVANNMHAYEDVMGRLYMRHGGSWPILDSHAQPVVTFTGAPTLGHIGELVDNFASMSSGEYQPTDGTPGIFFREFKHMAMLHSIHKGDPQVHIPDHGPWIEAAKAWMKRRGTWT